MYSGSFSVIIDWGHHLEFPFPSIWEEGFLDIRRPGASIPQKYACIGLNKKSGTKIKTCQGQQASKSREIGCLNIIPAQPVLKPLQ